MNSASCHLGLLGPSFVVQALISFAAIVILIAARG